MAAGPTSGRTGSSCEQRAHRCAAGRRSMSVATTTRGRSRLEDGEGEDGHAEVHEDVRLGDLRDALVPLRRERLRLRRSSTACTPP